MSPLPIGGQADVNLYARAALDVAVKVWGKDVGIIDAEASGRLTHCKTEFVKTMKIFGFDVVNGDDVPGTDTGSVVCEGIASALETKHGNHPL